MIQYCKTTFVTLGTRTTVITSIVSAVLGIVVSLGNSFYSTDGLCIFNDPCLWMRSALYAALLFLILSFILARWTKHQDNDPKLKKTTVNDNQRSSSGYFAYATHLVARQHTCTQTLLLMFVVMLLFLPSFLAFFPGNYSSDGPLQVTYLLNDGIVDLHWPAAHTLLLTGIMSFGNMLFGSYDAGLALFCFLQIALASYAMSFAVIKMNSWGVPSRISLAVTILIVVNPVVQAYVNTTAKDTLFGIFFLFTLVDAAYNKRKWTSPSFLCILFLSELGMCLMRKQGLYVIILTSLAFVAISRYSKKQLAGLASSVLILIISVNSSAVLVETLCTTRSDSARELTSLPSQQIVRTYMYNYDNLSLEQKEMVYRYYDETQLEQGRTSIDPWDNTPIGAFYNSEYGTGYLAPIADPAKGALHDKQFKEDILGYLELYLSLGADYKSDYLRAFLWNSLGYFSPSPDSVNRWTGLSPWNEFNVLIEGTSADNQITDYHTNESFSVLRKIILQGTEEQFQYCPFLYFWVSPSLPFFLMILSGLFMLTKKKTLSLVPAWLFPVIYLCSLVLGPVVCLRYVVPLYLSVPVIISLPLVKVE